MESVRPLDGVGQTYIKLLTCFARISVHAYDVSLKSGLRSHCHPTKKTLLFYTYTKRMFRLESVGDGGWEYPDRQNERQEI
jgi:hypothetical protein